MTTMRKCDTCGVIREGTRSPTGWRVVYNRKKGDFEHTCDDCASPKSSERAKKTRAPKAPPRNPDQLELG